MESKHKKSTLTNIMYLSKVRHKFDLKVFDLRCFPRWSSEETLIPFLQSHHYWMDVLSVSCRMPWEEQTAVIMTLPDLIFCSSHSQPMCCLCFVFTVIPEKLAFYIPLELFNTVLQILDFIGLEISLKALLVCSWFGCNKNPGTNLTALLVV